MIELSELNQSLLPSINHCRGGFKSRTLSSIVLLLSFPLKTCLSLTSTILTNFEFCLSPCWVAFVYELQKSLPAFKFLRR
jgi:hypothetical protein